MNVSKSDEMRSAFRIERVWWFRVTTTIPPSIDDGDLVAGASERVRVCQVADQKLLQ